MRAGGASIGGLSFRSASVWIGLPKMEQAQL